MEAQLEKLIELAALDRVIAGLQKKLAAIPGTVEERRQVYLSAEGVLERAKEELAAMQKEHRKAEGELESHLTKVRKLNEQTSLVKTNKEYQTLLAEIENLRGEQDRYEERILELMEREGEEKKRIAGIAEEVAREKAVFEQEETRLLTEAEGLREKLGKEEGIRGAVAAAVDAENLHMYNRVRSLRGDAVAEVRDELCLGCRVTVPPQKYADVITGVGIQTCSHCQRILYFRRAGEEGRTEAR